MAVLIVPGLDGSVPEHWQSWLQRRSSRAWRVEQQDWTCFDPQSWADAVARAARLPRALRGYYHEPVVAVAHGVGCLALVQCLLTQDVPIDAALLVAPVSARAMGLDSDVFRASLRRPAIAVASTNDPLARVEDVLRSASCWGASFVNVGDAGHLNVESGHGPWPFAQRLVQVLSQRVAAARRWEAEAIPAAQVNFAV